MGVVMSAEVRGKLLFDEPMSRHTSWRVGGPADRYFVPADLADLQGFLADMSDNLPVFWVGLGSNLLVRDGGIRGQVIAPLGALKEIKRLDGTQIYAECGVSCAKLARFCEREALGGAGFFAGIPGTVGGALAMNAGAFGGETWPLVSLVTTINRSGQLTERKPDEFEFSYRKVVVPEGEWFVSAVFNLSATSDEEASRSRQLLNKRNASQPIGEWSCGSVFKNPPGDHAARLIETSGLKGFALGHARVSEKHANFIISDEQTSAQEIETLIKHVQHQVKANFGVELECEVRIVGEAA